MVEVERLKNGSRWEYTVCTVEYHFHPENKIKGREGGGAPRSTYEVNGRLAQVSWVRRESNLF